MRAFVLSSVLAGMLALAGCGGGPITMIPGGALSGSVAAAPDDWTTLAAEDTIQVEFRPTDPYSINIWGVGIGPDLYIATGEDGTRWTGLLDESTQVRVRIGGTLFDLQAVSVGDAAEKARVAAAYVRKYELDPDDNWVATGRVYRMDRRP